MPALAAEVRLSTRKYSARLDLMLLLAIDTSGKNGGIALALATPGQSDVEIVEVVPLAGGTFSAQLVPQISALLEKHGYSKRDLAGFAVVSGPGSFTGLRVGLAAIKALAEVLRKPICSVSLLEAVARSGNATGRVLAALDRRPTLSPTSWWQGRGWLGAAPAHEVGAGWRVRL